MRLCDGAELQEPAYSLVPTATRRRKSSILVNVYVMEGEQAAPLTSLWRVLQLGRKREKSLPPQVAEEGIAGPCNATMRHLLSLRGGAAAPEAEKRMRELRIKFLTRARDMAIPHD